MVDGVQSLGITRHRRHDHVQLARFRLLCHGPQQINVEVWHVASDDQGVGLSAVMNGAMDAGQGAAGEQVTVMG